MKQRKTVSLGKYETGTMDNQNAADFNKIYASFSLRDSPPRFHQTNLATKECSDLLKNMSQGRRKECFGFKFY
jgi:hypothetical protein